MKKSLLRIPFLICFLLSFISQVALAQTTIDFNDLSAGLFLTKSYDKNGFNFSINAGGGGQIVTRSGEGYQGSISLYDDNFEIGALTQWTIKKIDGTEFQFHSIFLKEPNVGASTSGTIQGFKNGNPVGSSKTVDFNGLKSFVSDSDFYDIDEIRISAADINFHLDHFTFGPVYSPVDTTPAVVSSLSILGSPGPFATSISYSVNFNKSVTGVSTDDFRLTTTGTVTGNVNSVSGSGSSYTVTVNNISGVGTIRLDLKGGTDIANANGNIGTPAYTFAMAHTLSSNMNSDPTITGLPATITVGEDSTEDPFDISSASIGDIDAGSANLSLILVANGGVFDVAAGSGLTINGHLTDSLTLTGNLINLNNYINHPSNIYFRPIANLSGVGAASVTVYLTDNGNTGNGGGGTLNQGTVSINITPVNDAPIVSNTIPNQEASAVVAWSFQFAENTFTDVDDDDLTYSAELSNGNALPIWLTFTPSTRTFSGTPIVANIGNYEIKVIANDGNGKQVEDSFTLTVSLNNPNVVSVQSLSSNGGYKIGDVLTLQITFDQIVTVEGTPTLYLETGAVDAVATYSAGSGSSSLSFVYTVEEGHSSQDLDYVSFGSLTLNGGSIRNSNAIDASLTLPSHGDSGSLGANAAIVIDGIRPNVISKNVTIQLGAPGNTSIAASDIDNGSSDANGIASMTLSQYDFDCSHVGDNAVTLTVTDVNGNTESATAIVTVEDVTAPVVETRNITIQLDATGNASIDATEIDNGSTDACGIASMTLDKSSFGCGDVGANAVTLTVTDVNGNSDSATAIVTVEDVTAPVVETRNITIQLDATGTASITAAKIDNGSTDACVIASMTLDKSSFDCGDVGANTVTLTVTDVNGNTHSATAIVTVEDITVPVVVTQNITIQLDTTGNASITAADINNGSSDSCGIASMTLNQYDFDCSHVGDNTVTLTVTDVNGNTDTATAIVTVEGMTAPAVVTRNINIQLDATGNASISATDIDNGSTASCGIISMTLSQYDFDCSHVGDNAVTLTVTDVNGNTESATAIVTVEDITAPVVVTRNITIQLDVTGNTSITATDIDNGSSDSCGIASMTLDKSSFDCGDVGANTVTLTVTDVHGNTDSATATVTVEDITAPVVETRNVTIQLDATGTASIDAADIDNGSTDSCGIASMTLDKFSFDCGDVGANTVTLTLTDVNGNTNSATAIVTVEDVTAPVVETRNITIQLDATGTASITAAKIDNGSTDACGIERMTLDKSSFDCGDVGANTVTLTVTDVNGNSDGATATVTVEDITAPVVVTRNITTQLDATGNASITAADLDNGSTDACGIASMTLSQDSFDCSHVGDNTLTLTITDVNGNTGSATATVTVEDVTAPVVATRNLTIQLDATGNASIDAAEVDNGSTDACGIASMTLDKSSFGCGDVSANTVTLTVTDVNGNSDSATAIVTVEDVTAPVVVTRNIAIQLDATGNASITAADIDNGSTDSCGIASMTLDKSSFDCGDVGANTVILTVTDVNGNTDSAMAIVTVENTLPPTVQTRNITVQLDATGNASITAADAENGSSNSCAIAEMTLSKTGFTCSDIGHNVVTLTMTDVNGNIGSATAVVTVEDIIPATVLTQNITVQLDATGNASITAADIDNGSSDACGIADMTLSKTDFDCSDIGLNVVTLTVTDVNGNTATGTAVVTVEDVTAPSVLTQNITVQLNATGNVGITAADIDNGSSDACGIVDLSLSKTDFDCSNIGLNVVTLTVTDVNGNTDSATAVVTVEDVTAPSVLTQNITIQLDATGNAGITAADIDNGSSDSCGIASITLSHENFDCSHVGDNTVTLTVTDVNGNTDSSTAIVTVEDLTAPAVVNRNITIQLDASGNASITAADIDNGSSDVCGIASMSLDKSDFTCSDIGLNVVTLTVTDVNGNTATGTAVVTVEDVTAPSVLTQNITVQLDATGNASITAADIDNGSTDACGIASMTLSQENFDCSHVGDNTVTLTVTDLNGNTATGVAIVTVEDVTAPIVVTKNLTLTLQAVGAITIDAEDVDDGSYDSCGSFSLSLDKSQFDANDIGENIVTLTVTDESGNQSIGTAVVTILPREITGLSLPDRSFVYDGTIKSLTLTGDLPEGTTVTYTDNLRSDAGSQTVTAKVNGTNYTDLIFTANLTITPAVLHVTANSGQGKPFGKADPELTYTATGFVNGENLGIMQGSLDREEGESIGFYTISLGSVAAGSNYTITYSGAAFEIFSHDSDGDEVPDDVEIHDGTDPKDPYDYKDSDGDDVPDLVEVENGTNPLDPSDYVDSDGDQVPDYVEKREGTDPNNSKDYLDQDKDGVADYVQVRAITEFVASTTEVEWGTPLTEVNVPEQVLVITNQSEVLNLPIDWDLSSYNPRKAGSTVYTGVPELPAGRFNPYSLNPELSITVMDKPAPQDILLSNNQFVGIPDQFFQGIGSFTVVDPADNMHTFILPEGEGDNLHFEINEGHLFWSSADRQSGRDNFTLIVLVQDRAGNELRKSFSIQRLRTPLEQLEVFNSFTPNGDGVNDTWGVPALRYYNKVRIQVFDNAGNRVFYTENPDLGWDGTHHGKPLPVSSYVYVIEVGETGEIKRGMLNLLRQ